MWNFAYRKSSAFEEVKFTDWHLNNVYICTCPYIGMKLWSEGYYGSLSEHPAVWQPKSNVARRELKHDDNNVCWSKICLVYSVISLIKDAPMINSKYSLHTDAIIRKHTVAPNLY